MPSVLLPGQVSCGSLQSRCVHNALQVRRPQLHSSAFQDKCSSVQRTRRCSLPNRGLSIRPCFRCQASDSNGKPGMLWGIRNAFYGLGFGSKPSESSAKQPDAEPEQEVQQQPANDTSQSFDSAMPWSTWKQYFEDMDESAQKLEDLDQMLTQATLFERFAEAAKVKKQMDDVNSSDVLEEVLEDYVEAVQSEDYSKAASLRDAGATGLLGWWVSQNKEGGQGHLLHISPGFSRYVGYAFSPKDLARAEGLPTDESMSMIPSDDIQPVPLDEVGTPIMELFLKKGARGQLQQQGTFLSLPPEVLSRMHSSLGVDAFDPEKVTVEERKDANGNPVIQIQVNMVAGDAASEQLQAMQQQAQAFQLGQDPFNSPSPLADGSFSASFDPSSALTDSEVISLQRMPAQIMQPSRNELELHLKPLSAEAQPEEEQEQKKQQRQELVYDSRDHDSDDENEEEAGGTTAGEWAAQLLNMFFFPSTGSGPSSSATADIAQSPEASDVPTQQPVASSSSSGDGNVEVSIDEIASSSGRNEQEDGDSQAENELPSWETVVGQVLGVVQQLKRVAPNPGPTQEDKQRHIDLMQQLDEAEDALTPTAESKAQPKPKLSSMSGKQSESDKKSDSMKRPHTPPPSSDASDASLYDVKIQELMNALHAQSNRTDLPVDANGNNINQIVSQLAGQVVEGAMSQLNDNGNHAILMQTAAGDAEGKVMKYRRLNTEFVSTDPFTGLFLAAFGNQGPELLQLQRQVDSEDDTIEWVVGTKLTGDSNVPAGEVSFKARIGRAGRLGAADMYHPEMGVIARYKGAGCVAQPGTQQPTWVDGELLHLSGEGTKGAELGFVWSSDKHSSVLAVLKRVDLSGDH